MTEMEKELIRKINKILKYFGDMYDYCFTGEGFKNYEEFKNQLDEITFEQDGWLECKMEGKHGWAWLQIDENDMTLKAAEYTYNPEHEFYMSDDLDEFIESLED